jgi:hypothetical protein
MVFDASKYPITTITVDGVSVKCISLTSFAMMCGKTSSTIRKMEQRNIIPSANIRKSSKVKGGLRFYSLPLANKVAPLIRQIHPGKRDETQYHRLKMDILNAFEEERNFIINQIKSTDNGRE